MDEGLGERPAWRQNVQSRKLDKARLVGYLLNNHGSQHYFKCLLWAQAMSM